MPVVLLVRHGQAAYAATGYAGLTPTGQAQADSVGVLLRARDTRIARVACGTLARQTETLAHLLGTRAAPEPPAQQPPDPRWNEYDVGMLLESYSPEPVAGPAGDARGFQARLDRALAEWSGGGTIPTPDGGRLSWKELGAGVNAALAEVAAEVPSGATGVVVTSGGPITAVVAAAFDLGPSGVVAVHRVIANASITKVVVGRSGTSVVSFNEHGHVEAAGLLTYR